MTSLAQSPQVLIRTVLWLVIEMRDREHHHRLGDRMPLAVRGETGRLPRHALRSDTPLGPGCDPQSPANSVDTAPAQKAESASRTLRTPDVSIPAST